MTNNDKDNFNNKYIIDKQPVHENGINSTELAKLEYAKNIAYAQDVNREILENNILMAKSVLDAGYLAIKSAIVINGSAAIALLAFLGNIATRNNINNGMIIWGTEVLVIFGLGTFLAGVAIGLTYLVQRCYSEWGKKETGDIFSWAAISLVAGSYCAFALAIYTIHSSVQIIFK